MLRSILITMTLLCAAGAFAQQPPAIPADTRAWRTADAIDELLDGNSTELARRVACMRLMELGTGGWALRVAYNFDPSLDVRKLAWQAYQPQQKLHDLVAQLGNSVTPEAERLAACDKIEELGIVAGAAVPVLRMASVMDPSDEVRQRAGAALRSVLIALDEKGLAVFGDEIASSLKSSDDSEVESFFGRDAMNEPAYTPASVMRQRADAAERIAQDQAEMWRGFLEFRAKLVDTPEIVTAGFEQIRLFPGRVGQSLIDVVEHNIVELERGSPIRRRQAAERLHKFGALVPPAFLALKNALKDQDADVRDAAAAALGTPQALRIARRGRWVDELSAENVERRAAAVEALLADQFMDEATAKTIKETMKAPALARIGMVTAVNRAWREEIGLNQAVVQLLRQTKDPLFLQITKIALKILTAGSADEKVYQAERAAIVAELKNRVATSRSATSLPALRMLRELEIKPVEMIESLNAAVLSNDSELRFAALQALIEVGDLGIPGWEAMLKDPRVEVRGAALSEVSLWGLRAKSALGTIIELLKDKDAGIRRLAISALGSLGPAARESTNALLAMQDEADPDIREQSLRAARRVAPKDVRINVAFRKLLNDPDPILRQRAKDEVGDSRQASRPTELLLQLRGDDPAIRIIAARKLVDGHILTGAVGVALTKAVEERNFAVREGLVIGIEQAWGGEMEVAEALKKVRESETNPARRAYVNAALRALGAVGKNVAPK